jgi:hypothetical protein
LFSLTILSSDFETLFRQNIGDDLGKVIAKVSRQIDPSASVKVIEKKKKEKKQNEEDPKEQEDNAARNAPVGASDAVEGPEKPKDKKKKKKLKKMHSISTTNVSEVSMLEEQLDSPQGANNDKPQDPPQEKVFEHNNESSNSCLQPPPVKVLSKSLFFLYLRIFV